MLSIALTSALLYKTIITQSAVYCNEKGVKNDMQMRSAVQADRIAMEHYSSLVFSSPSLVSSAIVWV
jgi:hypothetical protein